MRKAKLHIVDQTSSLHKTYCGQRIDVGVKFLIAPTCDDATCKTCLRMHKQFLYENQRGH